MVGVINMEICMRVPEWRLYRRAWEANQTRPAGPGRSGCGCRGGGEKGYEESLLLAWGDSVGMVRGPE